MIPHEPLTIQRVKCGMMLVTVVLFCFCWAVCVGEMKERLEMSYFCLSKSGDSPGDYRPSRVGVTPPPS